jgi:hypothetical protein
MIEDSAGSIIAGINNFGFGKSNPGWPVQLKIEAKIKGF